MSKTQVTIPKGTRDFGPEIMAKRNYIFDIIKSVFQKFGFQPLETPTMENLEVLTGKYGEEGDQLIYRVLNSGDYLKNITAENFQEGFKKLTPKIADKALRYDLTVPFARYVVMNKGTLHFPFKRYQIQPVWRGDSPQKGRYREFYQCDADVVGTRSLLCEAEIVLMINEVMDKLRLSDFSIKINHRKIIAAMATAIGAPGQEAALAVSIDKLDKIGKEKVLAELQQRGFSETQTQALQPFFTLPADAILAFDNLKQHFSHIPEGLQGVAELEEILAWLGAYAQTPTVMKTMRLDFSALLARGLSYYTGTIFEVKINQVQMGSVSGGGRYDNLTGSFGLPDVSGVGFSFGVDRLYDVLEELGLFPETSAQHTQVLLCNFDATSAQQSLPFLRQLREANIKSELYPEPVKLKKQMSYADAKKIPFVLLVGSEEIKQGKLTLKNMTTGEQTALTLAKIIELLSSK